MELHKITIGKDAKVKVEVTGLKGQACKEATAKLQALGHTVSDEPTPELYEAENAVETESR
jgi:hypothetical protein